MERYSLRRIGLEEIPAPSLRMADPEAEKIAYEAIRALQTGGEAELRNRAEALDGLRPGSPLLIDRRGLEAARARIDGGKRLLLERVAKRISSFARAQRASLADLDIAIQGGRAGHRFLPVARAGCDVPGGRYPLPSSALMTVCAARAAGVAEVWCAGPRPTDLTLAASCIAGADGFLAAGGAHAIAALAFGVSVPACDVVAGPGGRYVAAAKRLLYGTVGTDAPAGPSELLVIAESGESPDIIAADLLAQAEHDPAAVPALIVFDEDTARRAEKAVAERLAVLPEPNRTTAASALVNGWILVAENFGTACAAANRFAPEHLEILAADPGRYERGCTSAGAVFLRIGTAEVLGDYGAGPNHCLPTGGASRFAAGLSVLTFLRARTWLKVDDPGKLVSDSAEFARMEGLEGHARAADLRAKTAL
ncbi:MAG: histidinol dehydrogenase [Rectinemataceae bacterium]